MARKGQAEELRCNGRLMSWVNEGARDRVHCDDCQLEAWVVLPLEVWVVLAAWDLAGKGRAMPIISAQQ